VRTRLALLGYLDEDVPDPGFGQRKRYIDAEARQKIEEFQKDAGLTADGWVGPQTWQALEELLSFEQPTNVAAWLAKTPRRQRAFWRAVGRRLAVLGLPAAPAPERAALQPALASFAQVAWLLKLVDAPLGPGATRRTLELLFDQDALVERLGRFTGGFPYDQSDEQSRQTSRLARRFVACVARIELWLLGMELDLRANSEQARSLQSLHPAEALFDFWRFQELSAGEARLRARQDLDGPFFAVLHRSTAGSLSLAGDGGFNDWLFTRLSRKDSSLRQPLWKTIQELGSRAWDGLRRAWSWVKERFQHGARQVKSWLRNLARLVYRQALTAYEHACQAFERLAQAVRFGLPGMLPGSQPPGFFIHASLDLDYTVFAAQTAQARQARRLAREMRRHARDLDIALQALTALLKALLAVYQAIIMPGAGWFIFIIALGKAVLQIIQAAQTFTQPAPAA
jgi:hypothetical protein